MRFEIKTIRSDKDLKYFNFNFDSPSPGLDLTTYIKYGTTRTTALILTELIEGKKGPLAVRPKYVFDSRFFTNYVRPTMQDDAKLSHYVSVNNMLLNGHAIKVQ
jgi:hypothetical protein